MNVVTPPAVACEMLVAPVPTNLKSPAVTAFAPDESLVTVFVSTPVSYTHLTLPTKA